MVDCPRAVKADGASHVQIVELGFSEKALGTIALAASTLAIGLAILAVILCLKSERESRLAQEDALFLKAALVAHGVQVDRHQLHKEEK